MTLAMKTLSGLFTAGGGAANEILPEEGEELVALLVSGSMLAGMMEEGVAVGGAAGDKREGETEQQVQCSAAGSHRSVPPAGNRRRSRSRGRGKRAGLTVGGDISSVAGVSGV